MERRKAKVVLYKYLGPGKKLSDSFEDAVDMEIPDVPKKTRINKIKDKAILKYVESLRTDNQIVLNNSTMKENLIAEKKYRSIMISIKTIKVKKTKTFKPAVWRGKLKEETEMNSDDTNFIKLIKYMTKRYKAKFVIDKWAKAFFRWNSLVNNNTIYFLCLKNGLHLELREYDIIKLVSVEVVVEDFINNKYTDRELKRLFADLRNKYIKHT